MVYTYFYIQQRLISSSACDQYSVPHHIQPHVELVTPTLHFDAKIEPIRAPIRKRDGNQPVEGTSRNLGQPGAGNSPVTTGKISKILNELENCDSQITLDCLRTLYSVVYKPVATKKNSFGIGQLAQYLAINSLANTLYSGIYPTSFSPK